MGYGYVPITVTNNESSATSTNFQQLVTVDLSYYSSFLNADLSNTFFSSDTAGSTVLNSWLESGNTYPFTSVNFWVVLPDGIAANSSATIYLQVDLSNANHFNTTTTGESPLLSSSYGEYDNGANVFNLYNNFAGTTLNPYLFVPSAASVSQNNGLTFSVATTDNQMNVTYEVQTISMPFLMISNVNYNPNTGGLTNYEFGIGIASGSGSAGGNPVPMMVGIIPNGGDMQVSSQSTTYLSQSVPEGSSQFGAYLWSLTISSTYASFSDTLHTLSGSYSSPQITSGYPSFYYSNNNGGEIASINYLAVSNYPPNGVMPSISTSNPVNFPYINTSTNEDLF